MRVQSVAERREALREGKLRAVLRETMKLVDEAGMVERLRHRKQRRDADPAGDEDRPNGVAAQREVVARLRNRQHVALPDHVMQALRAAARRGLALDADDVARALAGPVGDRILPDLAVRQMHVDMRAGLKGRQMAAQRAQLETRNA